VPLEPGEPTEPRYAESRDIWSDYNARQEFEHELINRKTTWSLSAQVILFAAYGVALNGAAEGETFRQVVASAGVAVAIVTLIGVVAVIRSKLISWQMYRDFYLDHEGHLPQPITEPALPWGVNTGNTLVTLLPDVALPLIFAFAWTVLLLT